MCSARRCVAAAYHTLPAVSSSAGTALQEWGCRDGAAWMALQGWCCRDGATGTALQGWCPKDGAAGMVLQGRRCRDGAAGMASSADKREKKAEAKRFQSGFLLRELTAEAKPFSS